MKNTDVPFRLRTLDHTDLFGIYLAMHAIPDSLLLLHTTVGCKFKTQRHLVEHDWLRESHNRRIWTGVDDIQVIRGSADSLLEFARTWYKRRRPGLLAITTNATVELTGMDVDAVAKTLSSELPCKVLAFRTPGYEGNLWRGYRRAMEAFLGLVDWSNEPLPNSVAIVGYVFDRYERDHAANLAELRRLLSLLGLSVVSVLFSGEPTATLLRVGAAKTLIVLPNAHPLSLPSDREVIATDLPIGLAGTANFLRAVGRAAGVDDQKVEALIERELSRAVKPVAAAVRHLRRQRVAIYLDTFTAAAVAAYLTELELEVPLVCLTDGDEADTTTFFEITRRIGTEFVEPPLVVAKPSRDQGLELYREAAAIEPIPVVIGSNFEQQGLEEAAVIELGFPSASKHFVYPMPYMGFSGAVALAQRLLDAAGRSF